MMKKNKLIQLLIIFSMLTIAIEPVSAKEIEKDTGVSITQYCFEMYKNKNQIENESIYDINKCYNSTLEDYVHTNSEIIKTTEYKYGTINTYSTVGLEGLVNEGDILTSVECFNTGDIYVYYTSSDGKEVIIRYNNEILVEKSIYNPETDEEIFISGNKATIYSNFRRGTELVVSDELIETIYNLVEENNWSAINNLPDFEILEDDFGNRYIEADSSNNFTRLLGLRSVVGFSNLSAMLAHLKRMWPTYTKEYYSTVYRTSNYLNCSVPIRLYKTRDTYVKKNANYQSFAISTALSVIASFLSVGSTSVVAAILDYLGYAYSAALLLEEAATLYRSANYKYRAQRLVYVYDSTVYNAYVNTYTVTVNDGNFAGGYDTSGNFSWLDQGSSIANYSDSTIISVGFNRYELDLQTNGYCYSFQP